MFSTSIPLQAAPAVSLAAGVARSGVDAPGRFSKRPRWLSYLFTTSDIFKFALVLALLLSCLAFAGAGVAYADEDVDSVDVVSSDEVTADEVADSDADSSYYDSVLTLLDSGNATLNTIYELVSGDYLDLYAPLFICVLLLLAVTLLNTGIMLAMFLTRWWRS